MAKLSLAQVYFLDGHVSQAEALLRALIAHPTLFVSKEQATLALASGLAKTNPGEARKLVEPLRTSRSAVSAAALELYGELQK
jgi:prepilin-type processing-associated H-X9-DG protein